MPRRYRRDTRESGVGLLVLLVIAILLLILLMNNGRLGLPFVKLPDLPSISIPITGLPEIHLPEIRVPVTLEPGKISANILVNGTPIPGAGAPLAQPVRTSGCRLQGSLPDPACTPGAVVSITNDQVCEANFTGATNGGAGAPAAQVLKAYEINPDVSAQYHIDQLVPLSLGGSNDLANLWPQPINPPPAYAEKNRLEQSLRDQVCAGKMSLEDAQRQIALNWLAAYEHMPK
jgi:hypothetical protein